MLFPTRVIRGVNETGPVETWVWSRQDLHSDGLVVNAAGVKTPEPIFCAGLVSLTIWYAVVGPGTLTLSVIPMDEIDDQELPFEFLLGSGLSGLGFQPIEAKLIMTSFKFKLVSTSTNTVTAFLRGRTA